MSNLAVKQSKKKKMTAKYLSSLEIKKYLSLQKTSEQYRLNTSHLQSFYRFCDEKSQEIEKSCNNNLHDNSGFVENTLHFALLNVLNDLLIILYDTNNYVDSDYAELLLESLKYSFPKDSVNYYEMQNDINIYGKHLHHSILSYFM